MIAMKDIRALARRIAREFKPQRIILFGSYAWGTPNEDSDVDLMVILPFKGKPVYKEVEIRLSFHVPFALDILARTPAMVRTRLDMGDMFMEDIMTKGVVLHVADRKRMGGQGRRGPRHARTRDSRPSKAEL